ncbi:MAG: shikimate kinase [Bacteroidota bacterium]
MPLKQHIILSGFMGCGKSTLGRKLAREWTVPFYDLDYRIEAAEEMSIPKIFEHKGETYFRSVERDQVERLKHLNPGIVALGGGSLQSDEIVAYLKNIGFLVYLEIPFHQLLKRIDETSRPLVNQNGSQKNDLRMRFDQRQQYYRQAHCIVSLEGTESIDESLHQLKEHLSEIHD